MKKIITFLFLFPLVCIYANAQNTSENTYYNRLIEQKKYILEQNKNNDFITFGHMQPNLGEIVNEQDLSCRCDSMYYYHEVESNIQGWLNTRYCSPYWWRFYFSISQRHYIYYDSYNRQTGFLSQKLDGNNWLSLDKFILTYDANGNCDSVIMKEWGGLWENDQLCLLEYDSAGNEIEFTWQNWSGNNWKNLYKSTKIWQDNKLISLLTQNWDTIQNSWINDRLTEYTYNLNGSLTTYLVKEWLNGAWENSMQEINNYDFNDNLITILHQNWENQNWINSSKYAYTYDANDNLTESIYQVYENNNWVNSRKNISTYDNNNSWLNTLSQRWTVQWTNYYRWDVEINGNTIGYLGEDWNSVLANWQQGDEQFWYTTCFETGISDITSQSKLILFPNPFKGSFSLETELKTSGNILVEIKNTFGQIVYSNKEKAPTGVFEKQIEFNAADGIYYLTFSTEEASETIKIIITN